MPSLKNLARIKDTATGKYLRATGQDWYSVRNNSWSDFGTAYKKTHIGPRLKEAAQVLAALEWQEKFGKLKCPDNQGYRGEDGKWVWSEEITEYHRLRDERWKYSMENANIPDTWVIEEFVITGTSGDLVTPAKDWKP